MKNISDHRPPEYMNVGMGQWHYNYNIEQVEVTDPMTEETRMEWQFDTLVIKSQTKPQILKVCLANPFLVSKSIDEIKALDVTFLEGLRNEKKWQKGRKIWSKFFSDDSDIAAVERLYDLVWQDSVLTAQRITMNWYDVEGSVATSKEIVENFTAKDSAKFLKDIRETQILYLQNPEAEYISPQVQQYIDMLFEHYKTEVSDYILNGSKSFETALVNESNLQIKGILSAKLDGRTILDRILEQIQWLD